MRKIFTIIFMMVAISATAQSEYDNYFTNNRLRIDLTLSGDAQTQTAALSQIHFEKNWSGTRINMIDPFEYGNYALRVYQDDTLIYSTGFCSLFEEWRTTAEAKEIKRSYTHSVRIPEPKEQVSVELLQRTRATGLFDTVLLKFSIDPSDKLLVKHGTETDLQGMPVEYHGVCSEKVDIVFVAEGYTEDEMDKYAEDVKRFTEYLFELEPYKSHREDFNIWMIKSLSDESGVDIPNEDIWKQTVADSHFYTFYTDRYLTIPDQSKVAKLTSNAPCDAIYVLANTNIYGGGGIYNCYSMCAADSYYDAEVFIHEFGHSFAGLADEYYDSEVAYSDYLNLEIEPWEPNITTLVDFDSKWKDMIEPDTPLPTPLTDSYSDKVGLFEGACYTAEGAYRPFDECRMRENDCKAFCPVCQKAIIQMIDYYCR